VALVREFTMLLVLLTSAGLLGPRLPAVARGVADSLKDACAAVEAYHAGRMPEIGSAEAFEGRLSGVSKTPTEMRAFFVSVFPHATEDLMLTGSAARRRLQRRISPRRGRAPRTTQPHDSRLPRVLLVVAVHALTRVRSDLLLLTNGRARSRCSTPSLPAFLISPSTLCMACAASLLITARLRR